MKKKIIIVFVIVTILFIFIILSFNFNSSAKNFNLNKLYGQYWRLYKIIVYEDDKIISQNNVVSFNDYMVFSDEEVTFCENINLNCKKFDYGFNNKNFSIHLKTFNDFPINGEYYIEIDNEILKLYKVINNSKFEYYFTFPKG